MRCNGGVEIEDSGGGRGSCLGARMLGPGSPGGVGIGWDGWGYDRAQLIIARWRW